MQPARIGAIAVPLNIRHQLAENSHIMEDCAAKVVVHEYDLKDRIPEPAALSSLNHAIAVRPDGDTPLAELLSASPVTKATPVDEEDTATILYTSGTTGRPKGAMLTHFGTIHSVIHYQWVMELTEKDRCLLAVPMSHVTGVIALIDTMVHCAGALVIMPIFKAADFIELAGRHRITYSLIVPAMFNLCLLAPNFEQADLSAWRVSGYGGAVMPEVTLERIAQKLPRLKLINTYGSTETTSPAVFMPPEEAIARKEYVGLTVPCGHIVVMNPEGVEVPYGTPGEIYIGGAMVVPGYWNNPEATEREFKAGYWKSGDLGIGRIPAPRPV
jgi:long-chain acyl-CoA synthetase